MEVIKDIVFSFGGLDRCFAFLLLIIVFLLINVLLVRNNRLRFFVSLVFSFVLILQGFSLYATQTFIGYRFFIHANIRGIDGLWWLFLHQIVVFVVLMVLFFLLFFYSYKVFLRYRIFHYVFSKLALLSLLIFVIILMSQTKFVDDTKFLSSVFVQGQHEFCEVMAKNGFDSYIVAEEIEAQKGKNIIVISLESYERAFLNDKFNHLTPNLNRLKTNWNYYDIKQNFGSNWTSGSLYTVLTGFPAFFGVRGNEIFKNVYQTKIASISNTLKKAGYSVSFFNGNANYSGTLEMLNAFHFDQIYDKYSIANISDYSSWGVRDMDLLSFAEDKILQESKKSTPFAFFISTTDTHYPEGVIYDSRMEQFIQPQKSKYQFMIKAVDFMIGKLIKSIEDAGVLSNTVVYIFPDHLKMGDPSMFKGCKRGLYCITNASEKSINVDTLTNLYQIDLAKIILNGADVKCNQKFLTDYILGNKYEYIKKNIRNITEINTSGWLRADVDTVTVPSLSVNYKIYATDTLRFIAHAGGRIGGYKYTNCLEALDKQYAKGYRLFELDIIETLDNKFVAAHDWLHWKKITKYPYDVPVTSDVFLEQKIYGKYTPLGMKEINKWFEEHKDAILVTDKINKPNRLSNEFVDKSRLMMEVFTKKAIREGKLANILSVLPSENVIEKMSWREIIGLDVEYLAVSRNFLHKHRTLIKKLQSRGVKVYVYGLNKIYDEEWHVKYEMDCIYGIYADAWSFKNKI